MKRSTELLTQGEFDIVVIGGGIYGACVAWDASLRGLSVALVEKGDFGQATSANSLKIVHGGLRYLQDGNLRLMRKMIRERSFWLDVAPHLVQPIPFVVPTNRTLTRNRLAFAAALAVNDLVGMDRNRSSDPAQYLPRSRVMGRQSYLDLLSDANGVAATGGALWYDAQIWDTERLLLSVIKAAVAEGAVVANYLEATGFLQNEGIRGITGLDLLSGRELEIRGRVVVNCAGPWTDAVLQRLGEQAPSRRFRPSTAMNLVTRQIASGRALGFPVAGAQSRLLFIVPWRGYSLVGTWHDDGEGDTLEGAITEEIVQGCLDEVNGAYPAAALGLEDVYRVHWGLLPQSSAGRTGSAVELVRESQVHDHASEGFDGLLSVVGVKYTSARAGAERAVDKAVQKLGPPQPGARFDGARVYGGAIERLEPFLEEALEHRPHSLSPNAMKQLVHTYGTEYQEVLAHVTQEPRLSETVAAEEPVIAAQVIHAVREEMALKLGDVIWRRTALGAVDLPDEACLRVCASLMARELAWDDARCREELESVRSAFRRVLPWHRNGVEG